MMDPTVRSWLEDTDRLMSPGPPKGSRVHKAAARASLKPSHHVKVAYHERVHPPLARMGR